MLFERDIQHLHHQLQLGTTRESVENTYSTLLYLRRQTRSLIVKYLIGSLHLFRQTRYTESTSPQ